MLRTATILLCLTCALPAAAQRDSTARTIAIESVDISGRRPMKEIGVQRTELDTLVLRENITASLADALATGSTIFIKSYGRATLATASFRGTAPSHTQVTWNDMKVNSPMLGQVDFSLIPAYFIDDATIYHGASSVGVTGGGLGGAVTLATKAPAEQGLGLRYVQGIGSFATFDEFLHLTYGGARWSSSTRVLYSTSDNDFRFRNYNSKEFVTDDNGQIVGEYYPLQRNRNGGFRDLHVMQELYYTTRGGDRFSLAAWYLDSHRGLAMLTSDRNKSKQKKNTQDERTLRAVAGWERLRNGLKLGARAGYTYTDLRYLLKQDPEGKGRFVVNTDARSRIHTLFAKAEAEYALGEKWLFSANAALHQHRVRSGDLSVIGNNGLRADTLYRQVRTFGVRRREMASRAAAGRRRRPAVGVIRRPYDARHPGAVCGLRALETRQRGRPGFGRPQLPLPHAQRPLLPPRRQQEPQTRTGLDVRRGLGNDAQRRRPFAARVGHGVRFAHRRLDTLDRQSQTGYLHPDQHPPRPQLRRRNQTLGRSRDFGRLATAPRRQFRMDPFDQPGRPADESVGKQLVYIPVYSAALTARVEWRRWELTYKWNWYSERYTMSSNDLGVLGRVKPYFMSDLSLEKGLDCKWASFSLKGCIHNLLNEEYESVLSRPMPRLNVSFFIGITPKFGKR